MVTTRLNRIIAVLLIVALALPLTNQTQTAEAKAKTQTFSNTAAITIPGAGTDGPASPYPSSIQVSGFKQGKVVDVNVTLNNFSHSFESDVGVLLQAPNSGTVIVMYLVGYGQPAVNLTLTLDDDAGAVLPFQGPLTSGTFRPSIYTFPSLFPVPYVPLSSFKGSNPNGTWQLFVYDAEDDEIGSLAGGWSLEITATVKGKKTH